MSSTELDFETGEVTQKGPPGPPQDPSRIVMDLDPDFGKEPVPKGADLSQKLEGEGIPEDLKGKTLAEALAYQNALKESLRISEEARKNTVQTVRLEQPAPQPVAPVVPQIPEWPSPEQIQAARERDPAAAELALAQISQARAAAQVEQRIAPLMLAYAANAEQLARTRFSEEFELFGSEILEVMNRMDPGLRGGVENWANAVNWVAGKPENRQKWVEKTIAKTQKINIQQQQQFQAQGTPGHFTANQRGQVSAGAPVMDPVEMEIFKRLKDHGGPQTVEEWVRNRGY